MHTHPFLTDLDTRAQVKGSVDPLGAMSIWPAMGRQVVGNLTTVSDSVKDFKTLLIGFALIEALRSKAGPRSETDDLAAFLRWEQLSAYIRLRFNGDRSFRGLRRVHSRLSETNVVPISQMSSAQILGNQKIYGLWGLFTVPARSSGLLTKDANELTDNAREVVDYLWKNPYAEIWPRILDWVFEDQRVNLVRFERELKRIATIWRKTDASERNFWTAYLVNGGPFDRTEGRQALFAKLLLNSLNEEEFVLSQSSVRTLASRALMRSEKLGKDLLNIAACESILAPASALFAFLLGRDGQRLNSVVSSVTRSWPVSISTVDLHRLELLQSDPIFGTDTETIKRWVAIAHAFRNGRYRDAVLGVLEINKCVMALRGGAPWIIEENGLLRVRFREDAASLPGRSEAKRLWRNSYFIFSLRSVVGQLEGIV